MILSPYSLGTVYLKVHYVRSERPKTYCMLPYSSIAFSLVFLAYTGSVGLVSTKYVFDGTKNPIEGGSLHV